MKIQIQVEVDLNMDTRTAANIDAAVADATDAAVERLGFDRTGDSGHTVRARVRTEVTSFDETIRVSRNIYSV